MKKLFARFAKDESGATAIEYGLIAGALAICIVAAMALLTPAIEDLFDGIATSLGNKTPTS